MRILVINYRDRKHPQAGGAEVHLHLIFGRLAELGHVVRLWTTSFPGAKQTDSIDGIEVVRTGGDLLFSARVALGIRAMEKQWKPDVIVEDVNKLPFYTTLFSKTPKFIQIHHLWGLSIFREALFPVALGVWAHERLIPLFYRKCAFAAVSPSTVSELASLGIPRENIALIHNGAEEEWSALEPQRDKTTGHDGQGPVVLWLGRLRRYKGVWVALRAFHRIAHLHPNLRLVFAGSGPEKSSLESKVLAMGLEGRVQVLGRVSADQKKALLRGALALVQSSWKEGWGLTVIEAAACGTCSVASRVPGLLDSVIDNQTGLLFKAGDDKDLADKLHTLLGSEGLRKRLEEGARTWARSFSWDSSADATLKALQKVVLG